MPPSLDRCWPQKNPLHETQGMPAPVSLIAASQSEGTSSLAWPQRPDNGGVSGTCYYVNHCSPADSPAHSRPALLPRFHLSFNYVAQLRSSTTVHRPTPRPIHVLRCCPVSTFRGLSGTRFGRYSSGSRSFAFGCCGAVYAGSAAMSTFQGGRCGARQSGVSAQSSHHERSLPDPGRRGAQAMPTLGSALLGHPGGILCSP